MCDNFDLCVDIQQNRDLSDSSSSVSELNAQLRKSEQLIGELRSSEAELKQTNTESGVKIAELKREIEHFKSMFILLNLYSCFVLIICCLLYKSF